MGVISSSGIVGKVKYVSENFATVISTLNTSFYISSIVKKTNTLSSVNWDGDDPKTLKLLYVPKHIDIRKGDEIISSSFDSIFPKGISIGKIKEIRKDVNSNFYDIDILSTSGSGSNVENIYKYFAGNGNVKVGLVLTDNGEYLAPRELTTSKC